MCPDALTNHGYINIPTVTPGSTLERLAYIAKPDSPHSPEGSEKSTQTHFDSTVKGIHSVGLDEKEQGFSFLKMAALAAKIAGLAVFVCAFPKIVLSLLLLSCVISYAVLTYFVMNNPKEMDQISNSDKGLWTSSMALMSRAFGEVKHKFCPENQYQEIKNLG